MSDMDRCGWPILDCVFSRQTAQLRSAAKAAEAWLDRWAAHVGNCPGGGLCSCGLEAVRHELRNELFDTKEPKA